MDGIRVVEEGTLETEYIPGAGPDFVVFIKSLGDKAELCSIAGRARWVVKREDGTEYIARPIETKNENN